MQRQIDRRKRVRLKCNRYILHSTNPPDFYYRGKLHNYSKAGLYFESNVDLLPGDEVFILAKEDPFSENGAHFALQAKIVWCKQLEDSSFDIGYGAEWKL